MVRKVLIVYENKGVQSIQSYGRMFHKVIRELEDIGKTVERVMPKWAEFSDGTSVKVVPLGNVIRDRTFTHLYFESSILKIDDGEMYIRDLILPMIDKSGNYDHSSPNVIVFDEKSEKEYI